MRPTFFEGSRRAKASGVLLGVWWSTVQELISSIHTPQTPSVFVTAKIRKKDVQAVLCQVCELAVETAFNEEVKEEQIEELCEPKEKHGRWLSQLDLINAPSGEIEVQNMQKPGECRQECSLAARACRLSALDDSDTLLHALRKEEDVAEDVSTAVLLKKAKKKVCKKKCDANKNKRKAFREDDEEFVEVDPKVAEMQDMMKDMKAKTGMGMQMYSRDDFAKMSEGDMEAMAAREQLAQDRYEARHMAGELPDQEL
ncbi:unnamed protein product [Amoebophrya sp. A120]|nr:unnamed protein product [Amoebophrya sp. A120]|eukprot:GSA120T00018067001.1